MSTPTPLPTLNLTPDEALELAAELQRYARDVRAACVLHDELDAHAYTAPLLLPGVADGLPYRIKFRIGAP